MIYTKFMLISTMFFNEFMVFSPNASTIIYNFFHFIFIKD